MKVKTKKPSRLQSVKLAASRLIKNKRNWFNIGLLALLAFAFIEPSWATDHIGATNVDEDVSDTFGPDSKVAIVVYIIEVIAGLYKYATGNKNPMYLIGIVVLVIASAGMFSIAGA